MPMLLDWAAAEGWNPGLHDGPCFRAADPGGFLLGMLGDEPAATISVVKYGDDFGFLGFYIVKPQLRGRGLGLRLWNAGMEQLAGRVVGLDGVVAQQGNYRKSGFVLAWQNIRHEGAGGGSGIADRRIVALATLPFEAVLAYDQRFFPADRSAFLRCWIRQPGSTALGFVEQGELHGYGMIRPCRSGFKIGPLFADEPAAAETLFTALKAQSAPTDKVYLDTPAPNTQAVALAKRHGMHAVFETARMYTGAVPPVPLARLYGVTSFELG
jgi:ribosomal protein S18 acetylase RimI-like enzyme